MNATLSTPGCAASAAARRFSPYPARTLTTARPVCRPCAMSSPRRNAESGRLLRHLEHNGASGREGWCELPGGHEQWEVPWNDLSNHADRFRASCVTEIVARNRYRDCRSSDLGRPSLPCSGTCRSSAGHPQGVRPSAVCRCRAIRGSRAPPRAFSTRSASFQSRRPPLARRHSRPRTIIERFACGPARPCRCRLHRLPPTCAITVSGRWVIDRKCLAGFGVDPLARRSEAERGIGQIFRDRRID